VEAEAILKSMETKIILLYKYKKNVVTDSIGHTVINEVLELINYRQIIFLIELPCRQGQLKDSFARIEGDKLFVLVDYRNLLKITPQFAQIANNFFFSKI